MHKPDRSDHFGFARLRAAIAKLAGAVEPMAEDAAPALASEPVPAAYAAYTTAFDEILRPEQIAAPAELASLHGELVGEIARLATTQAGWLRQWGEKIAARAQERLLLVTLLLDNSGSLRGGKIRTIAAGAALVAEMLERSGVIVEVLGFTTAEWRGGRSRQLWMNQGSPARPGRLNDLRHIIYKAHDDAGDCAANFALMLKEGVLKENIDGEALLWAAARQSMVDADEKIIVVMSDGAPVDDSTLTANHVDFLHDHLIEATRSVVGDGQSTLYGIYLEGQYRPFAYYPRSATIKAPEQMSLAILRFLAAG